MKTTSKGNEDIGSSYIQIATFYIALDTFGVGELARLCKQLTPSFINRNLNSIRSGFTDPSGEKKPFLCSMMYLTEDMSQSDTVEFSSPKVFFEEYDRLKPIKFGILIYSGECYFILRDRFYRMSRLNSLIQEQKIAMVRSHIKNL